MLLKSIRSRIKGIRLSLRVKLILSFSAIAMVLLLSSIISIMEYRQMSHYLSSLIADNINSINIAHGISKSCDAYNLKILEVIGDDDLSQLPDFDQDEFIAACGSLKEASGGRALAPFADSVLYAYSAYMLTSMELNDVMLSSFVSSRDWFVDRLQPRFNRLQGDIDILTQTIYDELRHNTETFDRGFYRSIIPGAVAVGVGILLVILLLSFMLGYYVTPLYRMLDALDSYRSFGKTYTYTFEGDDQMSELNAGVMELSQENRQLRRRLKDLKEKMDNRTAGELQ